MAPGRIGPIHSSSDWRIRMGRLRIPGHWDLRHVGGLLWFGAGSFSLHRRLGYLVVDRDTPDVRLTQGFPLPSPTTPTRAVLVWIFSSGADGAVFCMVAVAIKV